MFAFRRLHDLFENVLNAQASTEKSYPISVHQLQQGSAGPVDTSDAAEIDRDLPVGLARTSSPPAVFELGHGSPGPPPFDM